MKCAQLRPALLAAAANCNNRGILACKVFCRDCRSCGRAFDRDVDGIEDGEGATVLRIVYCNQTLDRRQTELRWIAWKVGVEFRDDVTLPVRQ